MPRVVTGRFRGAILQAPEGDKTRPTTDKVKEALFSIIQADVPGSEFLDLFAGSGKQILAGHGQTIVCEEGRELGGARFVFSFPYPPEDQE